MPYPYWQVDRIKEQEKEQEMEQEMEREINMEDQNQKQEAVQAVQEIRGDLNERECAAIIGGVISTLCQMTPTMECVIKAVRWWASPEAHPTWMGIHQAVETQRKMVDRATMEQGKRKVVIVDPRG